MKLKSKSQANSMDSETRGELAALRRAAANALKLGKATGTPVYVMRNGRIVDLNAKRKRKARKNSAARRA